MNNSGNNTVSIGNFKIKKDKLLLAVAVLLIVVVLVVCFFAFFKKDDVQRNDQITTETGKSADINLIYLLTSVYKAQYAPILVENGASSWNEQAFEDGSTWADMLMGEVQTSLFELLVSEYLYDEVYKQEFSKEHRQAIENEIGTLASKYGSKQALENELSSYTASIKTLERYYELVLKQMMLYEYMYGDNGVSKISEDSIKSYFGENYVIVDHIFLSTEPVAKPDGTYVSITEEQFNEKLTLIQEIYDRITLAGEDFYTLKEQYNEDQWQEKYYPNGMFVTNDDSFPAEFTTASLEMIEGDYVFVQTSSGLHLVHKLPMNTELYNTNDSVYKTIKSRLSLAAYQNAVDSYLYDINGDFKTDGIINIPQEMIKKINEINVLTVKDWGME